MKVAILTIEQKDLLENQKYDENTYFYPIQDNLGNWVISLEEINNCKKEEFFWIRELELINFEPVFNPIGG